MPDRVPERGLPRTRRARPLASAALALAALAGASTSIADEPTAFAVRENGAYVYASRSVNSKHIGDLAPGTTVRARRCGEPCESRGGFVAIEPMGFSLATNLGPLGARPPARARTLARIARRTTSRVSADGTGYRRRMRVGHSIALYADTLGRPFAERPDGTFVATEALEVHRPSALVGERDPGATLGFAFVDAPLSDGSVLRRYERRPVDSFDDATVRFRGATAPRSAIRLARRVERPRRVPEGASWVHVDVDEQVLTAYRGDRWVYATLVTTGALDHPTPRGTFRLHQKTRAMTMYGDEPDNYLVEDVEHVQFFRSGYALHAAYWHDHFGERGSHGCVNLSPTDARHLFAWAPPEMPEGWGTLYARFVPVERLYVVVD